MKRQDFEFLVDLLRKNAGWEFDEEQYFVVDKKISNFIREKGYASVEELIAELKGGSRPLIAQVVENMAFSDTSFYRDYDIFSRFENSLLPYLKESNRATKKLRFWSLGCSTGQETYSIAMGIKKKFVGYADWDIDILGTDISSMGIAKAQRGLYNNFEVQMGLNAKSILEFFNPVRDQWQVDDDLRRMVEFRRYNMLEEITFTSKFEVIFCRNVLRYFAAEYQKMILERLSRIQPEGGILYLSKNERINAVDELYDRLEGYNSVYILKRIVHDTPQINTPEGEDPDGMPRFVRPVALLNQRPFAADKLKAKK